MSSASTIPTTAASDEYGSRGMALIAAWLQRFQSRQAWLSSLQGLAIGALALLAGASFLMVLDAIGIVSDPWRWLLTICIEVGALALAISFGLIKPWVREPLTRVAGEVESVCPEVREQLLSCVELSSVRDAERNFSGDFLSVLQCRVAHALRERTISDLLPWSTIRGPCFAAIASWAGILGLCLVPRLEMDQRLRRALIPFADIERPSRTGIEVLKPARPSVVVPEHQAVEFEIVLSGVETEEAAMEWRTANGRSDNAKRMEKMIRIGQSPARFVGSLPIASDAIEYRFQAGDGRTRWRTVRPTPRPRVASFKHRIHFPEYTGLTPVEIASDRGSLTTLAGTRAEIGIEPSIPLTSATAAVERLDTGERESLPMTYSKDRSAWSFDSQCDADARYQVKLRARIAESDDVIENTFSPTHEVNVVADHPPAVAWMATEKTFWDVPPHGERAWIVSPEELIPLAARIADDLPGVFIEQQISINRSRWTSATADVVPVQDPTEESVRSIPAWIESNAWVPLDGVEHPSRLKATWVWDVLSSGASSGDTVAVRIAVKDSLEQVTYSPVIEFSLASSGFDRNRHNALLARASLTPELMRLSGTIRASKEALLPRLQLARSGNMPAEDRSALATEISQAIKQWTDCGRDIRILAARVVRQLPRPLDQSETEYIVRLVSRLEREHASLLRCAANIIAMDIGQQPKLVQHLQECIDQAVRTLHEADDHANRTVDIYRQFVGHEALTALTKDLLYLKQHEDEQMQRIEKMDFAMLARSQKIAVQYLDAIEQLARQVEPSVSQHLQNGFQNWYRVLDQTRNELNHRIQQEPNSETLNALANEVKRFAENLRHQHWAFNMDGGLWWNIADTRRDLIQRGLGIHASMLQSVDRLQRDQTEVADGTIHSDGLQQLRALSIQSAAMRVQAATRQMADRKELHQHRIPADPNFASDMGSAIGAWESQFELWAADPTISEESKIQKEIVVKIIQAYRVLETAHEMHDIRMAAESLQRLEQYEWESLEGRLAHGRIWDSIPNRIETVHQRMKDAGFPHPAADAYRASQWNEASNGIRRKLDPRRHANNENLVSAAVELNTWLAELRAAESLAHPTIDDARRFLASLAPSLVELARRAARETRALEEQSRTKAEDSSSPKQIEQQLENTERSIDRLREALLENAMRQDILDQQQLETAKDSDRARQWIDELRPEMRSATESLLRAQQAAVDAKKVEAASEEAQQRQNEVASALETIEKHFSLLEERSPSPSNEMNSQVEESRNRLRDQTQGDRRPLQSYDRADQLAEMAQRDPEALLRALEKELDSNEPMQRELSQLSQQAANDTIAQLKNAANEERAIARDIENADMARKGAKELQTQKLRYLADATERMAVSLLEKSSQVVQRMNLPETRRSINQVMEDLKASAREARSSDPLQPSSELDAKLQNLLATIQQAQKKLGELTPTIESKMEQAISKDEQQRQGQLTEMKSWQSLMRDDSVRRAKDQARELQQSSEQTRKQAEQKNQELQQKLQARTRLMEELKSHPDRTWVQEELDRNTIATSQASAEAENAKRLAESAQNLSKESSDRVPNIENAPRAHLDRPNPIAALADEQIASAAKELQGLQQTLQSAAQDPAIQQEPKPNASALAQARERQNQVAQTVEQLVDQMARSGRHEERLKNADGSKMLAEQSKAIERAASNEVSQAQQELAQASDRARRAEQEHASQSRDAAIPTPSPPQGAAAAQQRTDQAAQALSQLAQTLEHKVAPKPGTSAKPSRTEPSRTEPSSRDGAIGPQSAKEMARMLDSLDQQLRSQANATQSSGNQAKEGNRSANEGTQRALRDSADRVAGQLQRERMAGQQERSEGEPGSRSASSKPSGQRPDDQGRTEGSPAGDSRLPSLPTLTGQDWGRLREQRAEDVTQGKRDSLDPEYSDAIRAYFRALGERRK
jgi:hypothetical protein